MLRNILVVGGNGFIGSAICKAAVSRGMNVTSISKSGNPFRTPKGHSPAWTSKVEWVAADALNPSSYKEIIPAQTAVIHTLGTLLEGTSYKASVRDGNPFGLANAVVQNLISNKNPLKESEGLPDSYELLNRDSALRVCETFVSSSQIDTTTKGGDQSYYKRPFIFISAEDTFRPIIPARYIETKREAERGIHELVQGNANIRAAFIRPSLVYHPHFRPLTTPIAALLDLSSTLHHSMPNGIPTPASVLRAISSSSTSSPSIVEHSPSALASVAHALTTPPIHVDHVAEAVCKVIEDDAVEGVVDVLKMRELIGWLEMGGEHNFGAA